MMPKEQIRTDRLILRALRESDASEKYAAWLNDATVNEYLETHQATVLELKEYIAKKNSDPNALFFGIFFIESPAEHVHIGNVKLEPINIKKGTAHMGILIGDADYWGKGIATEVTRALLGELKKTYAIHTVTLGVLAENRAAIRVYEKCGFDTYEKTVKMRNGKPFELLLMKKIL